MNYREDKFMRLTVTGSLLLAALFPSWALAQTCSNNEIVNPAEFTWTEKSAALSGDRYFTGTMEIAEEKLFVGGADITTRVYRQKDQPGTIPGPTLVMQPGQKYVLKFHNTLPYEPRSPEHNVFKDPNVSNLHTHGLHISGMSPGDDVTRDFAGGEGGDFVYDIPADHMGGTFWYHAHHHGSTFLQVSAGAFGLIIIDDGADDIPPQVAAMEERHLVVAYLDPDVAGTGGDTLITGSLSPTWTVNGQVNGDVCMPPDTWQHWRVLLADRDAKEKTVSVGAGCEVALMARDGVWRTEAPKQLASNSLVLTGASRADLAVRCNADANIAVGGQTVANIVVYGPPGNQDAFPFVEKYLDGTYNREATWSAKRPPYLRDLRFLSNEPVNTETVNMGARTINGSKFDMMNPTFAYDATENAIQDWTLKGARNHPFHLHIYHVQVQGDCGSFEDGEYYDVISGNCNIRFDLGTSLDNPAFAGRTIMHCHILEHEDQGAMGWADVQVAEAMGPPEFPIPSDSNEVYAEGPYQLGDPPEPAPEAPSGLEATAISTSEIDLLWTDNANDETGFDIEQSISGGGSKVIFVAADTVTHRDTGLEPGTEYTYRVRAMRDTTVSDYSLPASATTDGPPPNQATRLQLRSLTVGTVSEKGGVKRGEAVVVVEDDSFTPVTGAVVYGYFNQSFANSVIFDEFNPSPVTDINGSTTMLSSETDKGGVTVGFCVTGISDGAGEGVGLIDYTGPEICVP
jgi:FtsP/CotA-like multicopper oxidase with cupredoxin domain